MVKQKERFLDRVGLFTSLIILLIFNGCMPVKENLKPNRTGLSWTYTHLLALDPIDTHEPEKDIIAVYFAEDDNYYSMRIDFLEIFKLRTFDLHIRVDSSPGGIPPFSETLVDPEKWDEEFLLDPNGQVKLISNNAHLEENGVMIEQNEALDYLALYWDKHQWQWNPAHLQFQVFTTPFGQNEILDSTLWMFAKPIHPPPQGKILLAFRNTLSSHTPAQLLRSWDGAHTGPFGRRHGLSHLLMAAETNRIPITLLDLKSPANLSALDYLQQNKRLKILEGLSLITLPDDSFKHVYCYTKERQYNNSLIEFVFSSGEDISDKTVLTWNNTCFYPSNLDADQITYDGAHWIPYPTGQRASASFSTFTHEDAFFLNPWKKAIILTAFSEEPDDFVVIGGDLDQSPWADALIAPFLLSYIRNHPWIMPLDEQDLLTLPSNVTDDEEVYPMQQITPDITTIFNELQSTPKNTFSDLAWDAFFMLQQTGEDPSQQALCENYLIQVRRLIQAAQWADSPYASTRCDKVECILATEDIFTIISLHGGRIVFAGALDEQSEAQWLAPTSQFAVGLSDPSEWDLAAGEYADPMAIPGAFGDIRHPEYYKPLSVSEGTIIISDQAESITKTFALQENRLNVMITSTEIITFQVPVALSPEMRFTKDWAEKYKPAQIDNATILYQWEEDGPALRIMIAGGNAYQIQSFSDSMKFMLTPEDPNAEYPPGHFIPFPLSIITLVNKPNQPLTVSIMAEH